MMRNNDKDPDNHHYNQHQQDHLVPPLCDDDDDDDEREKDLKKKNDDDGADDSKNKNDDDTTMEAQDHKPQHNLNDDETEATKRSQENDHQRESEEAVPHKHQHQHNVPQQHVADAWHWFRDKHNSPKYWVAPLVGLSDKAFRILCRKYGATMGHTEMSDPGGFARSEYYRTQMLGIQLPPNDGNDVSNDVGHQEVECDDRPLVLQLGSSDINKLLEAIKVGVSTNVIDAIELNCGCPQRVAHKGCYGAFLLDPHNQSKLIQIISTIRNSNVMPKSMPLLVKMRVLKSIDDTVNLAKRIVEAGAGILTVHGRTRYQGGGTKTVGTNSERLASWPHISAVKNAVPCPVIANGNVPNKYAIQQILNETGCDGVMSGCGLLRDPTLFSNNTDADASSRSILSDNNEPIVVGDDDDEQISDDDIDNNNNNNNWNSAVHIAIEYIELAIKYQIYPKRISKHLLWILEDGQRQFILLNKNCHDEEEEGQKLVVNLKSFPSIRKQVLDLRMLKVPLQGNNNNNNNNEITNENDNIKNGKVAVTEGGATKKNIDHSNNKNDDDDEYNNKNNNNCFKKSNRTAYFGGDDNCVEGILKKLCQDLLETTTSSGTATKSSI